MSVHVCPTTPSNKVGMTKSEASDSEGKCHELIFAPGILKVVTNHPDLHGFLFGDPPVWDAAGPDHSSGLTLEYNVGRVPIVRGSSGSVRATVSRTRKIVGGLEATRVIDVTVPDRLALHVTPTYLAWSRLRFTGSHPAPEEILSNLAVVGMLSGGMVPLHGGAVAKGEQGTALFAPSNTGKTFSTWQLVSKHGYDFLGDDMLASDGRMLHGFPFTATGVPPGVGAARSSPMVRLRKLVTILPDKPRLADVLDPAQIRATVPVRRIIFLRRDNPGTGVVHTSEATERILRLNRLEFRYLGVRYLAQCWWEHGFPNLQVLAEREVSLIERMVKSAEEILEIRSDDPADFAPRIVDAIE